MPGSGNMCAALETEAFASGPLKASCFAAVSTPGRGSASDREASGAASPSSAGAIAERTLPLCPSSSPSDDEEDEDADDGAPGTMNGLDGLHVHLDCVARPLDC